jgi:hypothetical protein
MAAKDKRGKVRDGLYGGSEDRLKNPFEEDDPIMLAMNSVAVSVMKRKREADKVWGLDRLAELVSEETRLRFWKQLWRCRDARKARDVEAYRSACGGMMRAFDVLEAEAKAMNAQPLALSVMEGQRDDGSVFAICADPATVHAYASMRPECDCWTMDEVAVILQQEFFTQAVSIKRAMPGAEVLTLMAEEDIGPVYKGNSEQAYALSKDALAVMESQSKRHG